MNGTTPIPRPGPTYGQRTASARALLAVLASAGTAAATVVNGVWRFLVAVSQARPRQDMLRLAAQYEQTDPLLAARLRKAARAGWLD